MELIRDATASATTSHWYREARRSIVSMCARSRWRRTVSQICGNSCVPKCENACAWQRAAAYCSRSPVDAFASAPLSATVFRRSRFSTVVAMSSNVIISGANRRPLHLQLAEQHGWKSVAANNERFSKHCLLSSRLVHINSHTLSLGHCDQDQVLILCLSRFILASFDQL